MAGASTSDSRWLVAAWARVEGEGGAVHRLGAVVAPLLHLEAALDASYAVIDVPVNNPQSEAFFAELRRVEAVSALACLEGILFDTQRGIANSVVPQDSPLLLEGYSPLFEAPADGNGSLTQDACRLRLEAWAQALEGINGGPITVMDHKELHASAKRARDAPVAAHAAHANTDSGQAAVLSPFVHSEGAAAKVSEPDRENSISVETTMVQEESEDTEEEEEGSGAGQKKHRRGGQPMRRSERIALVESMAPRQQPVPREEEHDEDRPRQRQRRSGPRPQQPIFPPGQPLPQVPFQVFCGTAKGTWDPEDPLVISVTEPAEPAGGSGGRGRGRGRNTAYTVSCSEFERLGGRGRNKNWKHSVRVIAPGRAQYDYPIVKFAEALGQPFDFKPRGPVGPRPAVPWPRRPDGGPDDVPSPDTPEMQEYLNKVEKYKKKSILERMVAVGYDAAKSERRLNSLAFRGVHRPGVPGQYDYKLLLPADGGVWVRSLDEISRHPMAPGMNEDDVIFPGDERTSCGRKECFLVAGHAGRCQYPPGRGRGRGLRQRRLDSAGEEESDAEGDSGHMHEVKVEKQREARQDRWSRRQW